jgi:hypothetical protein
MLGGINTGPGVRGQGMGMHSDMFISILHDLVMVDIACVHPAWLIMWGKASRQQ